MNDCVTQTSQFLAPLLAPVFGHWLYVESWLWTVVGFAGAATFGSRFVLQWWRSEQRGLVVVPWYFWHLSFWGSVLNLAYALHLDKAPLIAGSLFLPLLYGRNLILLRRNPIRNLGEEV